MKKKTRAALLDNDGNVIGEVFDAPVQGTTIKIAGNFVDNNPLNIKTYKISRSKRNLRKAESAQPVSKCGKIWTFHAVENNTVVY